MDKSNLFTMGAWARLAIHQADILSIQAVKMPLETINLHADVMNPRSTPLNMPSDHP